MTQFKRLNQRCVTATGVTGALRLALSPRSCQDRYRGHVRDMSANAISRLARLSVLGVLRSSGGTGFQCSSAVNLIIAEVFGRVLFLFFACGMWGPDNLVIRSRHAASD